MGDKQNESKLKWYHPRRLGLTAEYVGGIIAGFGFGIMIVAYVMIQNLIPPYWHLIMIFGLAFIPIGATIAHHAQRQ